MDNYDLRTLGAYYMKQPYWDVEENRTSDMEYLVGVSADGDILYLSDGEPVPTKGIFVLDVNQELFMGPRSVHHNDLVANEAVLCAGEYNISKGKISTLSNKSGHYQPQASCLDEVVVWFRERGITNPIRLRAYSADMRARVFKSKFKGGVEKITAQDN